MHRTYLLYCAIPVPNKVTMQCCDVALQGQGLLTCNQTQTRDTHWTYSTTLQSNKSSSCTQTNRNFMTFQTSPNDQPPCTLSLFPDWTRCSHPSSIRTSSGTSSTSSHWNGHRHRYRHRHRLDWNQHWTAH